MRSSPENHDELGFVPAFLRQQPVTTRGTVGGLRRRGAGGRAAVGACPGPALRLSMTHETDLPCSDCGTALLEATVPVEQLPASTGRQGTVTVAECPECGARYYPESTVTDLFAGPNGSAQGER